MMYRYPLLLILFFRVCFRFAGDYFRFEPIYLIEALNEYPVSYKFRFIGVFDVSEANRIPKPRLCGATRLVAGVCSKSASADLRNLR
jgi:hypothetical protein